MNEAAIRQYYKTLTQINIEIDKLQGKLTDYNEQHPRLDWTHVGDMQHILSQLQQINEEEEV